MALASTSCLPSPESRFAERATLSDSRRPDGVAIDLASSPPNGADSADPVDALVSLRTPLGVDAAKATVHEFFRAIVREDSDAIASLFVHQAKASTSPGRASTPGVDARQWWDQRFRKYEYGRVATEQIVRETDWQMVRRDDHPDVPRPPGVRLDELESSDVVVRVPILKARVGQDRLFGDEMVIWLRRDGARYRIFRIAEDFQLQ